MASPLPNATCPALPASHDLPAHEQRDGERVRPAEALAQERHGQQGDPDHERLLDERRLRGLSTGQPLEEEYERHRAADHRHHQQRAKRGARSAAPERAPPRPHGGQRHEQQHAGDGVLGGRVDGRVGEVLDGPGR